MPAATTTDLAGLYAERLAERLGDRLDRVFLYGSRARGEAAPRSDYDLMVVLRRPSGADRDVVHRLASEIELDRNVELSTKIVGRERFEELRGSTLPFWRRFARDARTLWPPTS